MALAEADTSAEAKLSSIGLPFLRNSQTIKEDLNDYSINNDNLPNRSVLVPYIHHMLYFSDTFGYKGRQILGTRQWYDISVTV